MKDFFKFMFASMLGFILVMLIMFFISLGLMMTLAAYAEKSEVVIRENTVIRIDLNDPVPERTPKNDFLTTLTSGSFKTVLGLNDVLKNIRYAKNDENVSGIILNLNMVPSGLSTIEEIRNALLDFKESGKFIYCYGEYMTQGAYYLGSVADEIYIHPMGLIDFKGLNAEVMFIKGMLDKLDINMQVVRYGKYKSAVEPLIQEEMSDANREQYSGFVYSIWSSILEQISASRGLSIAELNAFADELISYDAVKAMDAGIVDGVTDRDEYRQVLTERLGLESLEDINVISLRQYDRVFKDISFYADRIAVIYGSGAIGGGDGSNTTIGANKFAETIARVRKDDNVKAVVLRVNSPGGDALASDIILKELDLLNTEKTLIVSMGDVAASGGYWISCASDRILADPTTLTGSIGVFGVIPDFGQFMENKLGITYDRVITNGNSDFPSVVRPLTTYERAVMQNKVDNVYELFLERVSENRDMSLEDIDKIGEGRIWSGADAVDIGLVDQLGGLYDAIALAQEIAGLEGYHLLELPVLKDPITQMIDNMSAGVSARALQNELGPFYNDYLYIQEVMQWEGVQARLPFMIDIE